MNRMLSEWIYAGQSPDDLIRPAWVGALGVFVLALVLAMLRNRTRRRIEEPGRRLKGPEIRISERTVGFRFPSRHQ